MLVFAYNFGGTLSWAGGDGTITVNPFDYYRRLRRRRRWQ